MASAGAM
jgi:hypothetical protein